MTTNILEKKITNQTLSKGLIAFHFIIIIILYLLGYIFFKDDFSFIKNYSFKIKFFYITLFLFILLISIIIHELIHGYFFAKYNLSGWKSVKFGFNKELLAPYATCQEPIKVKHFRITVTMPTIILGLIPLLLSLFIYHNWFLFLFSAFMIVSGIGDLLVLWVVRKLDANQFIIDHPKTLGYLLIDNYQSSELQEIEKYIQSLDNNKKETKKADNKKILLYFFLFLLGILSIIILKKI